MRRSALLRFASSAALMAVCCYIALSAAQLIERGGQSAVLYERSVRLTAPVYGVFLRSELPLPEPEGEVAAAEGERFSAHAEIAPGLYAPASGVYSAVCDGLETAVPPELSVDAILEFAEDAEPPGESGGRLITSPFWSFYAVVEAEAADMLSSGSATLESEYFGGIELRLEETGRPERGFVPLRFSGSDTDCMYLRSVSGELLLGEYEGLCAPAEALREDEDGYYVEVLSLGRYERCGVELIYEGDGWVLIASPELRAGLEIRRENIIQEA
jgi:hypothetical protein